MTADEARDLPGVSLDAAPDEVRQRYAAVYAEFQVRLTNAPTAALQKLYRDRLAALPAAQAVLLGGGESGSDFWDLPSIAPVAVEVGSAGTGSAPRVGAPKAAASSDAADRNPGAASLPRRIPVGVVAAVTVLVVIVGGGWWLSEQSPVRPEMAAEAAAALEEDERLWSALRPLLDDGDYVDAAAAAESQGRPAVVVRIRAACEAEKATGHVVKGGCP